MPSTCGPYVYTSAVLSGPISKMLGLDWDDVLAAAKICLTDRHDRGFLVSAYEFVCLWDAMMALSRQSDMARLLGLRMASGPAIPVLFAMSSAPDFETGLARLAEFKHLFGPMRFAITQTSAECSIRIVSDTPDLELPGSFTSAQIVYLHAKAMALATRPFPPRSVSLPLPLDERKGLADLFGVVPFEGVPALSYTRAHARIPFVSDNPELWRATEKDLRTQALVVSQALPVADRVRASLLEAFSMKETTIEHVCMRLRMSRSTLMRRLAEEGATFQVLLDDTRKALAMRYLTTSDLNNQQIAHLIGYADPNAFQRAFKKWTGQTPQAVRQANLK
ncbi:MAG: AraC family transcriptional regulator [Rhodomicrobium sp.]|nr:AraC family transcriptional regulator [Rhodomicrobium sp.]